MNDATIIAVRFLVVRVVLSFLVRVLYGSLCEDLDCFDGLYFLSPLDMRSQQLLW